MYQFEKLIQTSTYKFHNYVRHTYNTNSLTKVSTALSIRSGTTLKLFYESNCGSRRILCPTNPEDLHSTFMFHRNIVGKSLMV